jgi:glycosyltransferase involved in cell wall biosynthesis
VPKREPIIFELHGLINKFKIFKLGFKIEDQIVILAPISKSIEEQLSSLSSNNEIVRAPMGIENKYLESNRGIQEYLERVEALRKDCFKGLKIGYVGKFFPNGYSKGIEDLLNLAAYNAANSKTYEISITGGSLNEVVSAVNTLRDFGLSKNEIEINGHISHPEAIRKMKYLDVLVLPMPASKKYVGFPLKAIESIASGRIVVAAHCKIYQDIFDESFEPYWYEPNDVLSLNLAIIKALNDESLGERLAKGLEFSSRFTWDARTKKLLDGLISSQDKLNS